MPARPKRNRDMGMNTTIHVTSCWLAGLTISMNVNVLNFHFRFSNFIINNNSNEHTGSRSVSQQIIRCT